MVGIDDSSGSDAALDPAADVAAQCGADLILVSAWETPRPDHWSQIYLADDAWRKEAIEAASQGAFIAVKRSRARAQKRHPKLTIHELVREGRPERVLVRATPTQGSSWSVPGVAATSSASCWDQSAARLSTCRLARLPSSAEAAKRRCRLPPRSAER